ncbi:MAG: shikimate kinase [Rikenellaceae bacterium]
MLIFLIGYMGCGKSTIGRKLSSRLGCDLVDTDHIIEERAGTTIADIFATKGEEHFRMLERETLDELIAQNRTCIVSTGGGLPMWGDNMEVMNGAGCTVYIRRTAENIASRLSPRGREKRPKLRGLNDEELVAFMSKNIAERDGVYSKATYVLEAVPMCDRDILDAIISYSGLESR